MKLVEFEKLLNKGKAFKHATFEKLFEEALKHSDPAKASEIAARIIAGFAKDEIDGIRTQVGCIGIASLLSKDSKAFQAEWIKRFAEFKDEKSIAERIKKSLFLCLLSERYGTAYLKLEDAKQNGKGMLIVMVTYPKWANGKPKGDKNGSIAQQTADGKELPIFAYFIMGMIPPFDYAIYVPSLELWITADAADWNKGGTDVKVRFDDDPIIKYPPRVFVPLPIKP